MIQIVMKPTPHAGVVDRETLYTAFFNGVDVGLRVRGLRASHAEDKLMLIFTEQLHDKTISYDLEKYLKEKEEKNARTYEEAGKGNEEVPQLP